MKAFYDQQVGRFEAPRLDDLDVYLARARRARAQALADIFGALYAGLKTGVKGVVGFVRCAGAGAALMPPQGHYRSQTPGTPARLTGGCE